MKQVEGNQQIVPVGDLQETLDIEQPSYVWRRWSGESNVAYTYFRQYLAQEQRPRKIDRLAKQLRMHGNGLRRYSAQFKWLERAAAFDDYNSSKELDKQRRHAELRNLQWEERRDVQREQEWEIAQELLDKVRQMLRVPLFTEHVEELLEGLDPDGRIIVRQMVTVQPLDWSATDMARFFEVASKMARLATGMATDQKRIRIDVAALTDEELEQLAGQ
jgi:hypothetical protein